MNANESVRQPEKILLEAKGISKGFPGVWKHLILDKISITIRAGEIHTLLGENGAGKTVLANILSGFYTASSGTVYAKGKPIRLRSPRDGIEQGIGMVHQELSLVEPFTLAENIAIGLRSRNLTYPIRRIEERVRQMSAKIGMHIDPTIKVEDLSAGERQRAEIMKVLYHGPTVLILDEPTSLIALDAENLFVVLNEMADMGYGILFVTHKIEEAMRVGHRITVLRLGKLISTQDASQTTKAELARLMFGKHAPVRLERQKPPLKEPILQVQNLCANRPDGSAVLQDVSFTIQKGEILGIAGISGNGQSELAEVITGLRRATKGTVLINGRDLTNATPKKIIDAGVVHIPEKRREIGVVEEMTVAENVVLKDIGTSPFSRHSFLCLKEITQHSKQIIERLGVLAPDLWRSQTRILSGGNIQRLLLAREIWRKPPFIVAVQPTHGLDVKAIDKTWELFMQLREFGSSILLISEDLDEILTLGDRVAVMFEGKMVGILDGAEADRERIGLMMATGSFKDIL